MYTHIYIYIYIHTYHIYIASCICIFVSVVAEPPAWSCNDPSAKDIVKGSIGALLGRAQALGLRGPQIGRYWVQWITNMTKHGGIIWV